MRLDLTGRIQNIPLSASNCLAPLFEAVINSIHAIEDVTELQEDISSVNGQITITIMRLPQMTIEQALPHTPITGFSIQDNGIGFNEHNFKSFNTSDYRLKFSKGGKGIGRFLWLKCFQRADISSTYFEDGIWKNRVFSFSLSENGVEEKSTKTLVDGKPETRVTLSNYLDGYSDHVPDRTETIAHRLIEHCLEYFVLEQMPKIKIVDPTTDNEFDLWNLYKDSIDTQEQKDFKLHGEEFRLNHFIVQARAGLVHKINYCGNQRVVKDDKLINKIPNLVNRLTTSNGESVGYLGYVSGNYLDSNTNQQRTDFDFSSTNPFNNPEQDIWEELQETVTSLATDYLDYLIKPIKTEKEDRIREYVQNHAPQYRYILKSYPNKLDRIPATVSSEDKLEIELFRLHHAIEEGVKAKGQEILRSGINSIGGSDYEGLVHKLSNFLEDWNEVGKANLAKYIVNRKAMLTFLEQSLNLRQDHKYALENAIHSIIFPLKKTSDDIGFEQQNLWIIDEKLVFHHYLASDMRLDHNEAVSVDSKDRPDIIIFDKPFAAVNVTDDNVAYSSVVIFELKRPMRSNYSNEDNPIAQVLGYVETIRNGDATDKQGRQFIVNESTPFYCYILGDMTKKLKQQCKTNGLTMTPDQRGFFGYNPNFNAYIEVISYDKLLIDARKRNQVLFDKLNITGDI